MNYMKQVAEILGVELGEEFKIECGVDIDVVYRLTETGIEAKYRLNDVWEKSYGMEKLLTGELVLEKIPWKPANGQRYYMPSVENGRADFHWCKWADNYKCESRYNSGLVCRTTDEAVEKAKKMLAALKEG